jgi:hypothetical protein
VVRFLGRYDTPDDPEASHRHYRKTHVALDDMNALREV